MRTPRTTIERRLMPWLLAAAFAASLSAPTIAERIAEHRADHPGPVVVVVRSR